jgi:hypothetical protein
MRNAGSAGNSTSRGWRQQLHGADQCHASSTRWDQSADKCQGAHRSVGGVDTDDDCAYVLRPADHEYGARGTADDTSRDAAHEQATNRPMSAPANHDDVRLETFGCAKNSLDGRLVRDFNFDVRPAA